MIVFPDSRQSAVVSLQSQSADQSAVVSRSRDRDCGGDRAPQPRSVRVEL